MLLSSLRLAILTTLCLTLTSCAVLNVHHAGAGVDGVPFYTKTAVCHHEAVWIEPVYTLTLQNVTVDNGKETVTPVGVAEFSLSMLNTHQSDIADLKRSLVTDQRNVMSIWVPLQQAGNYNPLAQAQPKIEDVVLASNTTSLESQVDYRDFYYFNSHRPIIGSAKADVKLNSDLTLSEGSGELESKTLQSFLDLFPISGLISKAAGIAAGGGPPPPPGPTYRLQIDSRGIKHTLSRYDAVAPLPGSACEPRPAPAFGDATYNRTRDDLPTETKPKDDKNSVKVSGQIQLPSKDQK